MSDAANPFVEWRELYYYDPVGFVREVLAGTPDEDQCAIMRAVARGDRRIAIKSGHGVGKTTVLAWLKIWWSCTRLPQKTLCTAPTSDQLFDALAAETKSWFSKLPKHVQDQFTVLAESISFTPAPHDSFISYRTSRADKPEALAGRHAPNMLIIGDEASGIPEQVFEAAIGSMSGGGKEGEQATWILAGNPVRGSGFFFECFNGNADLWTKFTISCENHPRITKDYIEQVRRTYGEKSNQYRVRVLGEFPLADDDTIIPADIINAAINRDVQPFAVKEIWGLDCARGGRDDSALARRKGNVLVEPVETRNTRDLMDLVGWVKAKWDKLLPSQRPSDICIDVIGVGGGVADRLLELGLPVRAINVSETPALMDERYLNQRAELWFKGFDWFNAKDCSLRGDAALAKELKKTKIEYTSTGKIKAESKADMKARGEESPNRADAFLLTLAVEAIAIATAKMASSGVPKSWSTPLHRKIKGITGVA